MIFANGVTAYRVRAGASVDPFSGEASADDWDAATREPYEGCAWAPGVAFELNQATMPDSTVEGTLFMPYDADVTEFDRVEFYERGTLRAYQVAGRPSPWRSPFSGWAAGLSVRLEEITNGDSARTD